MVVLYKVPSESMIHLVAAMEDIHYAAVQCQRAVLTSIGHCHVLVSLEVPVAGCLVPEMEPCELQILMDLTFFYATTHRLYSFY